MAKKRQPNYWCGNFDSNYVLAHGLSTDSWLMQYQYEHGGFEFQGNRRQKARTSAIWKALPDVEIGDGIIAYLSGSLFFAIGQVVKPKKKKRHEKAVEHIDSIERTVRQCSHIHFDGLVRYRESRVFYEDFTDQWSLPEENDKKDDPESWPYAQRIDVEEWQCVVPKGVRVGGLSIAAPFPQFRSPLFRVDSKFFARVSEALHKAQSR